MIEELEMLKEAFINQRKNTEEFSEEYARLTQEIEEVEQMEEKQRKAEKRERLRRITK